MYIVFYQQDSHMFFPHITRDKKYHCFLRADGTYYNSNKFFLIIKDNGEAQIIHSDYLKESVERFGFRTYQ